MRARAVVTLISGAAIAASTLFLACGNGDDFEPKPTPAADAAADGTVSEGGSKEAGETAEAAATSEAGETSEAGATSEAGETSEAGATSEAGETPEAGASEAGPDGG
jgi:hypothetical protein